MFYFHILHHVPGNGSVQLNLHNCSFVPSFPYCANSAFPTTTDSNTSWHVPDRTIARDGFPQRVISAFGVATAIRFRCWNIEVQLFKTATVEKRVQCCDLQCLVGTVARGERSNSSPFGSTSQSELTGRATCVQSSWSQLVGGTLEAVEGLSVRLQTLAKITMCSKF